MCVGFFSQLRRAVRRFEANALEREFLAVCARNAVFSRTRNAVGAAEGLFLASIFSTFLWSLILFTISRLR